MKLYMHPMSTTSRCVTLFLAESGMEVDEQVVDLFTGEHMKEPFASINPNRQVPVLEDGDFRLTESSAILKYLADVANSPAYPKDLKKRAKVNEMMDWFNSNLYRDYGYLLVYPQVFPGHKRPDDKVQAATLAWGKERADRWLKALDQMIGRNKFLTGDQVTIADYFGIEILAIGDCIRCDFGKYPNVARWIATMKALPSWKQVNGPFEGFGASMKDKQFERV
jgi:glutathione S-transferase